MPVRRPHTAEDSKMEEREGSILGKRTLHRDASALEYGLRPESTASGNAGEAPAGERADARTGQAYQGGYRDVSGNRQDTNAAYVGNVTGTAGHGAGGPSFTGRSAGTPAPARPSAGKRFGRWLIRIFISVLVFSAAGYIGERIGWFSVGGRGGNSSSGTLSFSPIPTPKLEDILITPAARPGDETPEPAEETAGTDSSSAAAESNTGQAETGSDDAGGSSDTGRIRESGVLLVGITAYPPLDYLGDDGNWTGFDADLAREAASRLGVEAEFVEIDWDSKTTDLENRTIDVVWNGLETGSETNTYYADSMECTDIYCAAPQVIVLRQDEADLYQSVANLGEAGLVIAAGRDTQGQEAAEDLAAQGLIADSVLADSEVDAVLMVASGSADAAVIDLILTGSLVGEGGAYPELTWKFPLTDTGFTVGCRKDSDLAAALNDIFYEMYKDGTMQSIAENYGLQEAVAYAWQGTATEGSASSGTDDSSADASASAQGETASAYPSLQQWLAEMGVPAGGALSENDFYYYDTDEYDEGKDPALKFAVGNGLAFSDEGNIVTARGIQNGSSADEVSNAYGPPSVTGSVSQNSVFYRLFHDYENNQETVEKILGKTFWSYIWEGNFLEFVFDESGAVIAAAFDSSHSFLNDSV